MGNYATSYIKTTSASVTRNADVIEKVNGSFLPTAYPFTIYTEAVFQENGFAFSFLDDSVADYYYAVRLASSKIEAFARQGVDVMAQSTNNFSLNTYHKIAVVYTSSNVYLYVNGNLEGSVANTIGFSSSINDLLIGQLRIVADTGTRTTIKALAIWNNALSSTECQTLTTI